MPCILPSGELNGISVPAICARHGGQWVGEQQPSLMSQPTSDNSYSGSGFPAAGTPHPNQPSTYSDGEGGYWSDNPVENLTPWLIPGAGTAKSTATYLGTKVLPKVLPKVKSVAQSLFTKPGQVQKTVPIIKKVSPAVTKKAGTLMKPIPATGQKMATKKITTDGRVISAPGVIGGGLVAAPIVKSIFSDEPVTDKKVVNQTAKGTPWADLAKGVKPDARDDMAFEGALMNNPEAIKEMAKSDIPDSIWDKMQTKGFWMDGVEGGAGKWDNKLFRLGEMMAYMGTPLSKRGDSPAKRWTSANTEQSKIKAAIEKERIKADAKAKEDADKSTNIYGKFSGPQLARTFLNDVKKQSNRIFTVGDDRDEAQMQSVADSAARRFLVLQESKDATIKQMSDAQKRKMALDEALLGL